LADIKKSRKKRKSWFRRRMELAIFFISFGGCVVVGNWIYQVWEKPSELVGVLDDHFHKKPEETWRSYGDSFTEKSTGIMEPAFLAALAQAESNGNPIVRTYWKLRWTTDLTRIFSPASSAVGMFQITEGTFNEARRFCVRDGRAFRDSESDECAGASYSRLLPGDAIEMTSARLHWETERLLRKHGVRRASLRDKQNMATVIHLCGIGKGDRLARARMKVSRIGKCGDHDPVAYVRRVSRLQREFQKFASRDALLARGD
jgi:hypothetical protein